MKVRKVTVAVDFDNTLISCNEFGEYEPIKGAAEAMQSLRDQNCHIVVYTCRTGIAAKRGSLQNEVAFIEEILLACNIAFDEIFLGEKLIADFYVDDRAIPFRGNWVETIQETEKCITDLHAPETEGF